MSVLASQTHQLVAFLGREPGSFTSIGLGLTDPVPEIAFTDIQASCDIGDRSLLIEYQRDRVTFELRRERPPRTSRRLILI